MLRLSRDNVIFSVQAQSHNSLGIKATDSITDC